MIERKFELSYVNFKISSNWFLMTVFQIESGGDLHNLLTGRIDQCEIVPSGVVSILKFRMN